MTWRRSKTPTEMNRISNAGTVVGLTLLVLFATVAIGERGRLLGKKRVEYKNKQETIESS